MTYRNKNEKSWTENYRKERERKMKEEKKER